MHVSSPASTDSDLYRRGHATLLASWDEYAQGSAGAEVQRREGVAVAAFPNEPERSIYNNAVFDLRLGPGERGTAIDAMESVYGEAGIHRYAAWAHDSDSPLRVELAARGYRLKEATRVMGISLDETQYGATQIECEPLDWLRYLQYLRSEGLPTGLLRDTDPNAFCALGVRVDGQDVATALAFDHDGDCGVFNMGTLGAFRRRGFATALLARHLQDAGERGCTTASLQSTPVAEGIYRAAGFRDLGRFLEYVPSVSRWWHHGP